MLDMDMVARLAAYAAGLEGEGAEDLVREALTRTERDGEEETVAWLELYIRFIDEDRAALFGQHIDELHEAQRQAAITVQAAVRGWLARRALERENEAATKIQALVRGHQVRKELQAQNEAATKIQALVRGHQVRKELQAQNEAATKIQALVRGHQVRKELQAQNEAATKIQALVRGHQVRKELQAQNEAATKIQALVRGHQVRKELQAQNEAATKIQALIRGYQARTEYQELKTAAVRLQAQFRMWQARRQLQELREQKDREEKIILVQSLVRGRTERKKYQALLQFYDDQEDDSRLVKAPVLRINSTVTLEGHRVLAVYADVVKDKLKLFYDNASKPAIPRNKNLVQVDTHPTRDGWLTAWAKLAWKELYASQDKADKPLKVSGESFPCIGSIKINGAKQHFVEEKVWVKVGRTDRATRYNILGDNLALGKSAPLRAQGIRKVLSGDLTGVADIEIEAALAMLGAETARNPRSYGVGLMLLDLVENDIKYGNNKSYTWSLILGSAFHMGENENQYEERKTGYQWNTVDNRWDVVDGDKADRWSQFDRTLKAQAPSKFHKSPVKALWAGKWPMSPSASMSLGGYDVDVPNDSDQLNAVQYKELKTILKWYRFVMRGIDVEATDEHEAEAQLTKLFRLRLLSIRMMDNGYLKQTWA
ncbi:MULTISPECIES: hypothetical protein [Corallococcus]|uniref:hypothetical protein n=1 Tax=Corallococcus TaxID=83461 RepID=UPI00117EE090|nr:MULTISPECIES: hypothetical protein [Corallococcus]NBD07706.1 hypothetical protein [Corallococcus silvisoli]TSC33703.1 hypothetical protein FOF48_01220 [Corallococcus sp. Z5C101001]